MVRDIIIVKVPKEGFDTIVKFNGNLKYLRAVNFKELNVLMDSYEDSIKEIIVEEVLAHETKDFDVLIEKAKRLNLNLITPDDTESYDEESFKNELVSDMLAGINLEEKKEIPDVTAETADKKTGEKRVLDENALTQEEHQSILAKLQEKIERTYKKKEEQLLSELEELREKLKESRQEKTELEEQQLGLLEISSVLEAEKEKALSALEKLQADAEKFNDRENRLNSELREALLNQEELLGSKNTLEEQLKEKQEQHSKLEEKSIKLLEVVKVLQGKDEKQQKVIENYTNKLKVLEESLDNREEDYTKLFEEYDQLREKTKTLSEQKDALDSLSKELKIKNKNYEEEKKYFEQEIQELRMLQEQREALVEELREKQEQGLSVEQTETEHSELLIEIESLKNKLSDSDVRLKKALSDRDELEEVMKKLRETSDETELRFNSDLSKLQSTINSLSEEKEEAFKKNKELQVSLEELKEKHKEAVSKTSTSTEEAQENIHRLENELTKSKELLVKKQEVVDSLLGKLGQAEKVYKKHKTQIEELQAEVHIQEERYQDLQEKHKKELKKVEEASGSSSEKSSTQLKELLELKEKLLEYRKELDTEKGRVEELQDNLRVSYQKREAAIQEINELHDREIRVGQAYKKLKKENDKLKLQLQREGGVNYDEPMAIWKTEMVYSSKAKILTFSGSGSRGVTQILMAVSRALPKGRICLMDFNANNPRLGAVIQKEPFIDASSDIKDYINRTSMGALIHKGENYFFENIDKTILKIGESKEGSLMYYFSGAYANFSYERMASMNFQSIINKLGEIFDYILIDIGTIDKTSGMSGELLRRLWGIAHKNIVITLKDPDDVRNTRLMLNDLRIKDFKKCLWILNFALNSKVDEKIQKSVSDSKLLVLPLDTKLDGYNSNLFKSKALRNNIAEIARHCQ